MLRPHVNAHDVSQFPGFGIILHSAACLLFANLPPHVWHCKIPIAPSCFGVIFAHGLVTQTRALLTFPTIKSVIADSLLCDPSLWDYPPSPRLYCSISINGKFLMWVFSGSPIWNCHIHILNHTIGPPDQLVWNDTLRPIIQLRLIESFGFWRNNSKVFPDEI